MTGTDSRAARVYRALLRLLPFDFRSDFGPAMETAFQEQHHEAGRQNGAAGVLRLWWETIVGVFRTAPGEHLAMFHQDAGFALRMMRKSPGFTLAAILTLGLGIGANSAIFSVVHAVLLKPLPYEHGQRLVTLQQQAPRAGLLNQPFSVTEINDYRAQSHSLDGLVEYHNMNFILLGRSEPERVETGVVSWNYFDVFGVKPLFGRTFRPEDEQPGAPAVLMLSYEYWIKSFGGDPTVVNKTFSMNDRVHTVIGVLPPVPQYPDENDVYMPTTACPFRARAHVPPTPDGEFLAGRGRRRPGPAFFLGRAESAGRFCRALHPAGSGNSHGRRSFNVHFFGGRADQPAFWHRAGAGGARDGGRDAERRWPAVYHGAREAPLEKLAHCCAGGGFLPAADWRGADVA